ncbi:hypothetical protein CEXT_773841 [Caerostris extrusa]|uniref:Uncharacterized protein n=1 Tax=Caerostris extrusa TaxID=172846 RepID=A0AAV4X518_CAEEX|nr:hypothetical protein CEXT_773841 [Caerostris extrusa]
MKFTVAVPWFGLSPFVHTLVGLHASMTSLQNLNWFVLSSNVAQFGMNSPKGSNSSQDSMEGLRIYHALELSVRPAFWVSNRTFELNSAIYSEQQMQLYFQKFQSRFVTQKV